MTRLWNAGCGATFVFSSQPISLKGQHTQKCTDLATGTTLVGFRWVFLFHSSTYLLKRSFFQLYTLVDTYHLSTVKSIEVLRIVLSHYRRKIETISSQFSHRAEPDRMAQWVITQSRQLMWPVVRLSNNNYNISFKIILGWLILNYARYASETAHKCGFLVYAM